MWLGNVSSPGAHLGGVGGGGGGGGGVGGGAFLNFFTGKLKSVI